jgi:hypothetical protein
MPEATTNNEGIGTEALKGDEPKKSFADILYDKITSVIGGNNPNQFFCMGLPGTLIDRTQYSYDVDKNEMKPSLVEANESKLVNKLFDACTLSASDNGRHLQTQYKTALDMLTPRLNGKLFDAKTKLRKVLMTPYTYDFGDGSPSTGLTLQQVFYKLYEEYVAVKQEWAQKQVDKKTELEKKYPGNTVEENRKKQNEYLDWYETTAEPQELRVEEKLGKVLCVFSPGDMEIITGILNSGTGREIAEARQTLDNVEKLNPDGGYVYPVTLYPEDWFTLLDTSFTPIDLLESPAALSQKLSTLVAQRTSLTTRLNMVLSVIPNEAEVKSLKDAYDKANGLYKTAFDGLVTTYTKVTVDMIKTFINVVAASPTKNVKDIPNTVTKRIFGVDADAAGKIADKLGESAAACIQAQSTLIDAAEKATTASMEYFQKNNLLQYKTMLIPLKSQLQSINDEITLLQDKINASSAIQLQVEKQQAEKQQTQKNNESDTSDVVPNIVPDRYMSVIITSKMSEALQQSKSSASASKSSFGTSFFFGGYSSNKSHQEAIDKSFSSDSSMEIQIGMSVAKVDIGREWFNPGVFLLSADMYNTSSEKISPSTEYKDFSDERFAAMNKCVFPCFSTAFVIARDISIKFISSSSMSDNFAQSVEEHAASGGGFFIFGGSSSSSSSSSSSDTSVTTTSNSVTIRMTSPQILGHYLEATPPDKSDSISKAKIESDSDLISIFDFITAFQKMLDDCKK